MSNLAMTTVSQQANWQIFSAHPGVTRLPGRISIREVPHEANFLKLDCSKIRSTFGWKPHWQVKEAIAHTVEWYQAWLDGADMAAFTDRQIQEYLKQNV